MTSFIRRMAACVALILAAAGSIAPLPALAQQEAAKAPPAAAVAAPTVTKEVIDNPYGLEALWRQGDFVSKGTLIILVIMSMGSWYIIFVKLWEQSKLSREGRAMGAGFWKAASLKEGAAKLKSNSAYRYIAESGVEANEHHEGTLTENIDLNTWATMSVQRSVD